MSLNAAALRILAEKGFSAADIAELAEAMEVRKDPTAADRMRRYRARKDDAVTRNVTTVTPPIEDTSYPLSSETKVSSEADNSARASNPFPRPEWADPQHWRDFMANRKRRRMTNSPTAYDQFLGDVARLTDDEWPPGRLLQLAAGKGWGSLNRPDQDTRNGHSRQPSSKPTGYRDPILGDAFDELHSRMAGRGDAECGAVPSS